MSKIEISELERLANSTELVAPIKYNNPQGEGGIFYQFVKDYGYVLDIPVTEKKIGFIDEKKKQVYNVRVCIQNIQNLDIPLSENLTYLIGEGLGLVLFPILYPFTGSIGWVTNWGDSVTVNLPNFTGVRGLFWSEKPHEYMHVYHLLAFNDLKQKGLLPHIEVYGGIGLMEPQQRVPTKDELKKFERRFLHAMMQE
ncbi:hypothetical protein FP803_00370 [Candidatus Woesearchaeota archaeon]|nr:hypothetical protein [Candidatus Woesearchaeota archaeon]